jgi:hypothetical protein
MKDPNEIATLLQECKDRNEVLIRGLVPPTEGSFIEEMKYIFDPLCDLVYKYIESGKNPNTFYDQSIFINEIQKRVKEVMDRTPGFNKTHFGYIISFFKAIEIDSNQMTDIPDEIKYSVALDQKKGLQDFAFINDLPASQNSITPLVEYVDRKIEQFEKVGTKATPVDEFFKKSKSGLDNKSYLFDKTLIERLDTSLRGVWLEKDSPPLISVMETDNWMNTITRINWIRQRPSLLYLFYLLNDSQRPIANGTITQFISRNFKVKGIIVDERNLTKSFSKMTKILQKKKTELQLPQYFSDIKKIAEECKKIPSA